jgi:hypothetical protein
VADEAPRGYTLVFKVPGSEQRTLPIREAKLKIGRDDENDVVLKRGTVSRKHAELHFKRGRFVIVDLVRDDGITVDGRVVNHTRAVQLREKVVIGGCTLVIEETTALAAKRAEETYDDPVFRAELKRRAIADDWVGALGMLERLEDKVADRTESSVWRFVESQYLATLELAENGHPDPAAEADLWGRLSLVYRDRLADKRRGHEALKAARRLDRTRWGMTGPPPRPTRTDEGDPTEPVAIAPLHVEHLDLEATDKMPVAPTHVERDDPEATDEIDTGPHRDR